MTGRRQVRSFLLLSVVGIVATACGSSASSSRAPASTAAGSASSAIASTSVSDAEPDLGSVTMTVAVSTNRGKGRQVVRQASGAFEGAPYTIKWAEFGNGDAALQSLNSGAADLMGDLQTTNAVIAAGNSKEPWTAETRLFSVVGAFRLTSKGGALLVVKSDSGINSVADLKGKKVAYSKGSSSEFFWSLLASEAGFVKGDVEEIKLKLSEARTAFDAGEVDALVAFDYNLLAMTRTGSVKVLASTGAMGIPLYTLIVARRSVLDDPARARAVGDLIGRFHAAEAWPGTHVAETRKIWEELDDVDPLDSEQYVITSVAGATALGPELIAAVQQQIDVFHARGLIEHRFDANVLFDLRFEG